MGVTKKQLETIKTELKTEIQSLYLNLGYSKGILEDYKSDLQMEVKDVSKAVTKANRKLKVFKTQMEKAGIRIPTIRNI